MSGRLIDHWFPVAAVDEACGTPAGSGQNEKAIFTWFASRPIAQARAAVLCSLLPVVESPDAEVVQLVERAIRTGDHGAISSLGRLIPDSDGRRPVVLDCFSGRGIIPLEAARLGLRAVGIDNSPVAVLASRLLADYGLRDWSHEPAVLLGQQQLEPSESGELFETADSDPKLLRDLRQVLAEVDRRVRLALVDRYPSPDGELPWGYLWSTTIPCDGCGRLFPLVDSLVLRHPYAATSDPGQWLKLGTDGERWSATVREGVPESSPTFRAAARRGKSAWCLFCDHQHPLDAVKAKGFAGQYEDVILAVADLTETEVTDGRGRKRTIERKVFRDVRPDELAAALIADGDLVGTDSLSMIPDEAIAPGNTDSVRATGYGYATWGSIMNRRQALLFGTIVREIRAVCSEAKVSEDYQRALAAFAASFVVRRLRRATRGAALEAYGDRPAVGVSDIFTNQSAVAFGFSWFETGIGDGPGSWSSVVETGLRTLRGHVANMSPTAVPGTFRRGSARSLPYRDETVDAIVTDPPYYQMIDYADVSDLFYVWLRRCLYDLIPDLFGEAGDGGVQSKAEEIIVKRSPAPGDHRTVDWYEMEMSTAFREMKRVLRPGGTLSVVFGHSDPDAWRRLLGALRLAGFIVTSAWPARTESGSTGVASIKVTVTIGCSVAAVDRPTATAAQVEREIIDLVRKRVPSWDEWNLALSDQRMAAYGPAMQVVGRYKSILRPDGTEPDLDHFLTIGRRAVADAHSFKIDGQPLDTFDALTRFALFWLRAYGRTTVNKGEARFEAQSAEQRIEDLRGVVLTESNAGFVLTLDDPGPVGDSSPIVHVARAMASSWPISGTEGAAEVIVSADREPEDAHLWGTISELVRRLPESSDIGKALTACQRNRSAITATARRARQHATNAGDQITADFSGENE